MHSLDQVGNLCRIVVCGDDDHQAASRLCRLAAVCDASVVACGGTFARADTEVLVQGLVASFAKAVTQRRIMLQARNATAPCFYIFKGHMQSAMGV